MGEGLKLHLGCGPKLLAGYVNIDAFGEPDLKHDFTQPLPFADETVDEVLALHVFEHFYRYDAQRILKDWVRVLKPGGLMVLEMPCLDKIVWLLASSAGEKVNQRYTLMGLYGDPGYKDPAMCHRWCYSKYEITGLFERCGLDGKVMEPLTHVAQRDMRIEGRKIGSVDP